MYQKMKFLQSTVFEIKILIFHVLKIFKITKSPTSFKRKDVKYGIVETP